jgi:hypothetical protein
MLDLKEHRFEMQDLKTVKSKCVFISNLKMSFEIRFEFKTHFFCFIKNSFLKIIFKNFSYLFFNKKLIK